MDANHQPENRSAASEEQRPWLEREIMERKRAEQALRESEERLHMAVRSAPITLFTQDLNLRYTWIFNLPSGFQMHQLIGRNDDEAFGQEGAAITRFKQEVLETGTKRQQEICVTLQDGPRCFNVAADLLRRADGKVIGLICAAVDITDRKESERKHEEMLQTMMRAHHLESLARLTGNIAHHFNNQLTVVLGNVELAESELPEASPLRLYLWEIRTAAERAARLSSEMLTSSGHAFSKIRPGNLSQLVESCRALVDVAAAPHTVVHYKLAEPGPAVRMDERLLQQLLLHWVTNSVEAAGERMGEIVLETGLRKLSDAEASRLHPALSRKAGRYAFLRVSDNGGGLPREMEDRLFDPFASTKGIGRGLGLSVSLGIASAHHGGIEVHSRSGEGCIFTLFLPESAPETTPQAAQKLTKG